jgi:hypothetical protein
MGLLKWLTGKEKSSDPEEPSALTEQQVKIAVDKERRWLNEYNAVSAVTGGPVEDLESVPLLTEDVRNKTPPAYSHKVNKEP